MKNSTLLFRSLLIVIVIAGSAHFMMYSASDKKNTSSKIKETPFNETKSPILKDSIIKEKIMEKKTIKPKNHAKPKYNPATDFIIDKWKVTYNEKDFKGSVIYQIKKENKKFNAYTFAYQDEHGNSQKAKKQEKILIIISFDGYKGKGIYHLEYEGKKYDVECQIDMVDENTFKLSYEYYSYGDIETWKRY